MTFLKTALCAVYICPCISNGFIRWLREWCLSTQFALVHRCLATWKEVAFWTQLLLSIVNVILFVLIPLKIIWRCHHYRYERHRKKENGCILNIGTVHIEWQQELLVLSYWIRGLNSFLWLTMNQWYSNVKILYVQDGLGHVVHVLLKIIFSIRKMYS